MPGIRVGRGSTSAELLKSALPAPASVCPPDPLPPPPPRRISFSPHRSHSRGSSRPLILISSPPTRLGEIPNSPFQANHRAAEAIAVKQKLFPPGASQQVQGRSFAHRRLRASSAQRHQPAPCQDGQYYVGGRKPIALDPAYAAAYSYGTILSGTTTSDAVIDTSGTVSRAARPECGAGLIEPLRRV